MSRWRKKKEEEEAGSRKAEYIPFSPVFKRLGLIRNQTMNRHE